MTDQPDRRDGDGLPKEALTLASRIDLGDDLGKGGNGIRKRTTEVLRALATPPTRDGAEGAGQANLREAWSGFQMIRETIETLGPVGALPASEHLAGPTFTHEAEALVTGIRKIASAPPKPVRGDREALLPPARRVECVHGFLHEEPADPAWRLEINGIAADFPTETWANNFRNAILSIPVQPGADEREWPQPFTTAPRDGTPILARCNDHSEMYALRWDGEHWACRDAQTTFGDGLLLPNGDWCLDPFSRQAPHSSSEGGR